MANPLGGLPPSSSPPPPLQQEAASTHSQELREKLTRVVRERFGGDWRAAFRHFDRNNDLGINRSELKRLLTTARVGGDFTRDMWTDGILDRLDGVEGPRDGKIQWREFQSAVSGTALLDGLLKPPA